MDESKDTDSYNDSKMMELIQNTKDAEELNYIMNELSREYDILSKESNIKLAQLAELQDAKKTIEEIESVKDKKSLIPLGAGVLAFGQITNSTMVLLSIGAGYIIEANIEEAKQHLKAKSDALNGEMERISKKKKSLSDMLSKAAYRENMGNI
ncbi:MAG: prefoldin subunit alpha [Candidatus Micrarchaeia archaeon]